MKMKKMMVGLFLVLGIVGVSITNAFAVEGNFICTIDRIGGFTDSSTGMYVMLTANNNAFPARTYFRIPEARLNQVMAVLLTAASNGATVVVRADPDIAVQANRILKYVYMNVE